MKQCLILFFVLLSTTAPGQFLLKGKVVAADTGNPLVAASVFLSNTSTGTLTDSAGSFSLYVPAGKYDLIASYVGYETYAQTLSEKVGGELVIALRPKTEVFDEVVVGGYEKDGWKRWGSFFLRSFIGTSEWAAGCTIRNQEAVRFRELKKEGRLLAIATDQLVIENKALGYTIKYQLEDFEFDFKAGLLLYVGYPLFIQMEGSAAKQNRWQKRRGQVYYGSMMQFMRALYRNRIREEGYEVRRMVKHPNEEKLRVKDLYRQRAQTGNGQPITLSGSFRDSSDYYGEVLRQPDEYTTFSSYTLPGDSIAYATDSVTAALQFGDYLHITYTQAAPPNSYRQLSPDNKRMASQITLVSTQPIQVQQSGNFYPPTNLISSGYWGWSEKVANMLPFDYVPPVRKQ